MEKIDFCFYLIEMYNFMRIKCEKCSHDQDITYDSIIFDDEDEKMFVIYLAAEMAKSEDASE
jgi:formate dehydrogenase maturation protein FdhE